MLKCLTYCIQRSPTPPRSLLQCNRCHFTPRGFSPLVRVSSPSFRQFSLSLPRRDRYVRFSPNPQSPFDVRKWDLGLKVGVVMVLFGAAYYVYHLEQVPETGRWRFMDTAPSIEAKLREVARAELHEAYKDHLLPANHPITKHVRRVTSRILSASNLGTLTDAEHLTPHVPPIPIANADMNGDNWNPDASIGHGGGDIPQTADREWDLMVVNDRGMINASASFGVIMLFTGILPICRDEHGLAAVLSHEIGHVVARHQSEKISSNKIAIGFALLLAIIGLDYGFSEFLSKILVKLPHSRMQEREADIIGLRLMSQACFDPKAAPEMFTRLGEVSKNGGLNLNFEFLATHPAPENRVQQLEELLPEGYAVLAANPECGALQSRLEQFKQVVGVGDGGWVS